MAFSLSRKVARPPIKEARRRSRLLPDDFPLPTFAIHAETDEQIRRLEAAFFEEDLVDARKPLVKDTRPTDPEDSDSDDETIFRSSAFRKQPGLASQTDTNDTTPDTKSANHDGVSRGGKASPTHSMAGRSSSQQSTDSIAVDEIKRKVAFFYHTTDLEQTSLSDLVQQIQEKLPSDTKMASIKSEVHLISGVKASALTNLLSNVDPSCTTLRQVYAKLQQALGGLKLDKATRHRVKAQVLEKLKGSVVAEPAPEEKENATPVACTDLVTKSVEASGAAASAHSTSESTRDANACEAEATSKPSKRKSVQPAVQQAVAPSSQQGLGPPPHPGVPLFPAMVPPHMMFSPHMFPPNMMLPPMIAPPMPSAPTTTAVALPPKNASAAPKQGGRRKKLTGPFESVPKRKRCRLGDDCPCCGDIQSTARLSQSEADVEKSLMRQLVKLEKIAESYSSQADTIRRRLKTHRRDMWKKRQHLIAAGQSTGHFMLPEYEVLDQQLAQAKKRARLPSGKVSAAQHKMFNYASNFQPTLTQMVGGVGDGVVEGDPEERVQEDDGEGGPSDENENDIVDDVTLPEVESSNCHRLVGSDERMDGLYAANIHDRFRSGFDRLFDGAAETENAAMDGLLAMMEESDEPDPRRRSSVEEIATVIPTPSSTSPRDSTDGDLLAGSATEWGEFPNERGA